MNNKMEAPAKIFFLIGYKTDGTKVTADNIYMAIATSGLLINNFILKFSKDGSETRIYNGNIKDMTKTLNGTDRVMVYSYGCINDELEDFEVVMKEFIRTGQKLKDRRFIEMAQSLTKNKYGYAISKVALGIIDKLTFVREKFTNMLGGKANSVADINRSWEERIFINPNYSLLKAEYNGNVDTFIKNYKHIMKNGA